MRDIKQEAIVQMVVARLSEDMRTSSQAIDVSADGDVVSLLGWCDREDQKMAAESIVEGTQGVRAVVDRLRVRDPSASI